MMAVELSGVEDSTLRGESFRVPGWAPRLPTFGCYRPGGNRRRSVSSSSMEIPMLKMQAAILAKGC